MKRWLKQLQLGDQVGTDEAAALITKIKEKMAINPPKTEADVRTIIESAAKELGIDLKRATNPKPY